MTKNNEMILRVLEAQNKKDDKEAFDYVEKTLGFETWKDCGFHISNPANKNKDLYITRYNNWRYCEVREIRVYRKGGFDFHQVRDYKKIDFYSYLTKPFNQEYHDLLERKYYGKKDKYSRLKSKLIYAKENVDRYERWISETKAELKFQIDNLTHKIEGYIESKANANAKLEDIRKEIALCRG